MINQDVRVRSVRALRGPSIYAYMPVIEVILEIGAYDDRPSNEFPGFIDRLVAWLPGISKHECSVGRPGGFIERLKRGTYLAHITEHITLELLGLMGYNVTFGRARGTGEDGVYTVVFAYRDEEPSRAAFDTALHLTLAAMHDQPFEVEKEIERLKEIADDYRLGPSTASIVRAAQQRDIPVKRITPTASLIQLGYGVHQKRIMASETSNTSAIAVELCQEKPLTNHMLRSVGVPVPDGGVSRSADEAWAIAQAIGLPVVVKPQAGNQGKGVSVNLTSEAEVRAAYDISSQIDRNVLVEKFIEGGDHRILVVNGKMVAAARREPAQVKGDGVHTVRELVAEVNKDPRRREGHGSVMTRIKCDNVAALVLQQQGYDFDSVPKAGEAVKLRNNSNLSTGGTATDVTDDVHPQNVHMAELAAQFLALDVAGIDVVCKDISRPLNEQDGAIVEVNAAPGLRMHISPAEGKGREVGKPIIDMLYPNGAPSRIPIIAVTGTNGKTTVTRLVAHMYETARWLVGMTCTEGTYIGKQRVVAGDCSGPKSASTVLMHPHVEVAVLETARGGILREGLAFDGCTVGVVTNISSDHLGMGRINTLDDLARVKQVVIEAVRNDGAAVLNADDPLVAEMAAATDAPVIYFSSDCSNRVVQAHLDEGGKCVCVDGDAIVLLEGRRETRLVELERVPFTLSGKVHFQVMNALAATAAAWGAGLNPAMIVRALSTFSTDIDTVPGRFNVFEVNGVQIVLDYGHNKGAMQAIGSAIHALGKRKTVMMIGLPGDRRDGDLIETFNVTRSFVDAYVINQQEDLRERKVMEVPMLLRDQLPPEVPCALAESQRDGIRKAWQWVKPGDRLMVIADMTDEAVEILRELGDERYSQGACVAGVTDSHAVNWMHRNNYS
jgi:cyanophycin synthetase